MALACRSLLFVPLSLILVQCGHAPNPGALAVNAVKRLANDFDDRFPKPDFKDRFPTANETLLRRQLADFAPKRAQYGPNRSGSLR